MPEKANTCQPSVKKNALYIGEHLFLNHLPLSLDFDNTDARGTFVNIKAPDEQCEVLIDLGKIYFDKFVSSSRQKVWWMIPSWGTDSNQIPFETQFILMKLKKDQELYAVILPLVTGPFRTALQPGPSGSVILRAETGDSQTAQREIKNAALIAAGSNPYQLLSQAFKAASERVKTFSPREGKELPKYMDTFGYCTWNAFYEDPCGKGIVEELESFKTAGVPPKTVIIDDGWQDTLNPYQVRARTSTSMFSSLVDGTVWVMRQLVTPIVPWFFLTFAKRPIGNFWVHWWRTWSKRWPLRPFLRLQYSHTLFPWSRRLRSPNASAKFLSTIKSGSFKGLVEELKQRLGVAEVYAWHSLLGYWTGVQPDDKVWPKSVEMAMAKPMQSILQVEPEMEWDPLALSGIGLCPPDQLYASLHSYLASNGVDGVKIDIQSVTTMLGEGRGGSSALTNAYVQAAERSVAKHFGSSTQMISCMSHASECLYSVKSSNAIRASDDFWPDDPASHSTHIVHVAYNSLFISEIAQPDWDMFQTKHPAAGVHAVARAVSGGPVYVSDKRGAYNFDLLRRLVLPDSSVLRASLPARPTRDCLFSNVTADGESALKVWNRNATTGVLAAFNLQGATWSQTQRGNVMDASLHNEVSCTLRPSDIEGLTNDAPADSDWVVATMQLNGVGDVTSSSLSVVGARGHVAVTLPHRHSAIATIAKLNTTGGVKWAALGLHGMLNGGGAVLLARETGREEAKIEVRGEGRLDVYCDKQAKTVKVDDVEVETTYQAAKHLLQIPIKARTGTNKRSVRLSFA